MKMYTAKKTTLLTLALLAVAVSTATGQNYRRLGTEFEAMREVQLPGVQKDRPTPPKIVVVEFLHHGLIKPTAENDLATANVAVVAKNGEVAPMRLLQLGPGDFCRLAFEPIARQTNYEIYYGGAAPPSPALLPKWVGDAGLLFESREYRKNDLYSLQSLRDAFLAAKPIGADYVDSVHHAHNPTDLRVRPFLSRYSGKLRIDRPGEYLFWLASQDCSFLVIDGEEVASAPGRHGPQPQARPNQARSVRLSAGRHDFEFYHAAVGNETMMVVAWQMAPYSKENRPALLPPAWFENEAILRVEPGTMITKTHRLVPDFDYRAMGEVPLPEDPTLLDAAEPLVGVGFRNRSPSGLITGTKLLWDFGDGQTSTEINPSHVYLRPGEYSVSLTSKRGAKEVTTTNRIVVDRPYRDRTTKEKAHTLDDYLPLLAQYDPAKLDARCALQLALAYVWKAEQLNQPAQDTPKETDTKNPTPSPAPSKKDRSNLAYSAKKGPGAFFSRAVDVGLMHLKAADTSKLAGQARKENDRVLHRLALSTGEVARFDLGKPREALAIYRTAAQSQSTQSRPAKLHHRRLRAECAIRAADIAINELSDRQAARALLASAEVDLGLKGFLEQVENGGTLTVPSTRPDLLAKPFFRVLGDYAASLGKGNQAIEAYRAATNISRSLAPTRETAKRGAHSRSTEQFLKDRRLDRAARELAAWAEAFPDEKIDGYFTLLYARLLFARGQYEQAIAQCDRLSTVNPESPYLDRLLLIASESQERLGRADRATALLRELIDTHPGSPLVPEAKRRLP